MILVGLIADVEANPQLGPRKEAQMRSHPDIDAYLNFARIEAGGPNSVLKRAIKIVERRPREGKHLMFTCDAATVELAQQYVLEWLRADHSRLPGTDAERIQIRFFALGLLKRLSDYLRRAQPIKTFNQLAMRASNPNCHMLDGDRGF